MNWEIIITSIFSFVMGLLLGIAIGIWLYMWTDMERINKEFGIKEKSSVRKGRAG